MFKSNGDNDMTVVTTLAINFYVIAELLTSKKA